MDKTLIKEVSYNATGKMLVVEFKDGSKYGETGETARKTFEQLNDNDVKIFNTEEHGRKISN